MQLLARNTVILLIIQFVQSPIVHKSPAILICFIAWILADLPRFAWLIVKSWTSSGALLSALTSIRYSSFIILYPLGGIGEFWSMYNAIGLEAHIITERVLHVDYTFDAGTFVKFVYMPLFIPGFLFLYTNMLSSRKRRQKKLKK